MIAKVIMPEKLNDLVTPISFFFYFKHNAAKFVPAYNEYLSIPGINCTWNGDMTFPVCIQP